MKKILIADDEYDFVEMVQDRLEKNGYVVLTAHEGVRAVEAAHKQKPDLILLDLKMPAGTGQSVLKAVRSHPETKNIPVIVITALPSGALEKEIKEAGAEAFFRKPFNMEKLLEKIESLLS